MLNYVLNVLRKVLAQQPIVIPPTSPDMFRGVTLAPLTVDADGWLVGENVHRVQIHKSWHYPGLITDDGDIDAIVWHYTDTDPGTAESMAKRRQVPWSEFAAAYRKSYPGKTVPQNSWHITIERDGSIYQMASLKVGCWHAIGTIDELGAANRTAGSIELVGRGDFFSELQAQAAARVARAMVRGCNIDRKYAMCEHSKIDPKRRKDPGKVWMSKHANDVIAYAYAA